jgi:putative peptidoglycan lipid II flippase
MVTLMTFVQNLILYSILAFIFSITAVVFPKFTMLAAKEDMDGLKSVITKVLRMIIYFLIPATFGFIAIRYQLVDFLVGWGKVTPQDVSLAGKLLSLYAIGVTGLGIKEVIDRVFYSLKDTKKPAINGIVIMIVNIAVSLILIRFIGVYGIPIAYSVSALTGAIVLLVLLRGKIGAFGAKKLLLFVLKVASSGAIMLLGVYFINIFLSQLSTGHVLVDRLIRLGLPAAAGAVIYLAATYIFKLDETLEVINKFKSKVLRLS